jgi:phosphoglycolate phosphatase
VSRRAIRTVTIDLDGTLLDTVDDLASACNAMLVDLGRETHDLDRIARFVGKGMRVLVERCLDGEGTTDAALLAAGVAAFRRRYAEVNGRRATLYPGVREGLKAMRDAGLKLACVTNKPAEFTEPLLERSGLAGYFSAVVSGDTLSVKKPDPAPIRHACELLGGNAAENAHIGDSIHDVEAALAAGSLALLVPYGYGGPMDSGAGAGLVSGLVEAAAVVARLNYTEQSS